MLNPLAVVFQQFRHAMITHKTISVGEALGSWSALLAPLAIVLGASSSASGCSIAQRHWSPRISDPPGRRRASAPLRSAPIGLQRRSRLLGGAR